MSAEALSPTARRAEIREFTAAARALLREAARKADGELETVRHNLTTALVATDDALDAVAMAEALANLDEVRKEWER